MNYCLNGLFFDFINFYFFIRKNLNNLKFNRIFEDLKQLSFILNSILQLF
ncbi:hypothetical protein METSMIALI_01680 [Methanobrevibacter smithii DSM 2375]|uniref:Uncharacterized protein n=1 Tax=Methanobrevibacter smithii DSM 2375 TaxID=483214 RepID=B9AH21_METSM|nr:hypothetical protein METSMIALI_01680 [Methanobrevibacter smithii DSM 2375]